MIHIGFNKIDYPGTGFIPDHLLSRDMYFRATSSTDFRIIHAFHLLHHRVAESLPTPAFEENHWPFLLYPTPRNRVYLNRPLKIMLGYCTVYLAWLASALHARSNRSDFCIEIVADQFMVRRAALRRPPSGCPAKILVSDRVTLEDRLPGPS